MGNNISKVYKRHLCCSCSICGEICPRKAIDYKIDKIGFYQPVVDKAKCTDCGICLDNCPGMNDLKNYSQKDEYYCYGYSNNNEHHRNCASGGIATELLCYLISHHIVDYVTVVTNRQNGQNPHQILTNDVSKIIECRGSKYCPVAWNGIVDDIKKVKGRVAICGLPCQINALKNYFLRKRGKPDILYISLFCNHTPSLNAADYIVYAAGKTEKLQSIINRSDGFPGYMKFTTKDLNGEIHHYRSSFRKTMRAGYGMYFKNLRCFLCNDPFSKNADISMADSYFLQDTDTEGTTFCVVRNEEIKNVLQEMAQGGVIFMQEGPSIEILEKYYKPLYERERLFARKNQIMRVVYGSSVNNAQKVNAHFSIKDVLGIIRMVPIIRLGRFKWLWPYLTKKNKLQELIEKLS